MLHRPQSIFLVITVIVLCLILLMPIRSKKVEESDFKLRQECPMDGHPFREHSYANFVYTISWRLVLLVRSLNLMAIFIAIYELCKYDNRVFQIKLGLLNAFLLATLLGLSLYLSTQKHTPVLMNGLLPAIALASDLLAHRYIRRDERLIKTAERIR